MGRSRRVKRRVAVSMPEYKFPADESISEHVPEREKVVSVTYVGDTEIVETEEEQEVLAEGLGEADRSELYSIAKERGVEVNWSGEDADTEEDMRQKIAGHEQEEQ